MPVIQNPSADALPRAGYDFTLEIASDSNDSDWKDVSRSPVTGFPCVYCDIPFRTMLIRCIVLRAKVLLNMKRWRTSPIIST